MITDFIITLAGCFVFDIETGLYSFLGLAVRSFMIDGFIESLNLSKYFNVVCTSPKPICDFIKDDLHRSATIVLAQGAFSGEDKYIIFTALNRIEPSNSGILLRKMRRTRSFLSPIPARS